MAKKRVSFTIQEATDLTIEEFAKENYQGNKSMALDMLVAEHQYLLALQVAHGQQLAPITQAEPTEQERLDITGVKGG